MFTLKLNPSKGNVAELKRTFDYVGLYVISDPIP